jgi:hypothetical protein
MSELVALFIMISLVVYVVLPLFRGRQEGQLYYAGIGSSSQDLHYQKRIASEIIQDLHFDHQTGKLSDEDHRELVQEQEMLITKLDEQHNKNLGRNSNDLSAKLEAEIAQVRAKLLPTNGTGCKQCGKSTPGNAKFCPECGAPLTS